MIEFFIFFSFVGVIFLTLRLDKVIKYSRQLESRLDIQNTVLMGLSIEVALLEALSGNYTEDEAEHTTDD
jgi:hypothetical protein